MNPQPLILELWPVLTKSWPLSWLPRETTANCIVQKMRFDRTLSPSFYFCSGAPWIFTVAHICCTLKREVKTGLLNALWVLGDCPSNEASSKKYHLECTFQCYPMTSRAAIIACWVRKLPIKHTCFSACSIPDGHRHTCLHGLFVSSTTGKQ